MDFMAVYAEAGMIGIVGVMFVYLVISLSQKSTKQQEKIENKGQSETLQNMESILIKLVDRWNKSDDTRDRRNEDLLKEVNDMSDKISYLSGRINGSGRG